MHIKDVCKKAAETSQEKGFHNGEALTSHSVTEITKALLLIHSEVSEATELTRVETFDPKDYKDVFTKPCGFGSELADIVIRTCELAERCGIDLDGMVKLKMAYNKSRPHKHGKTY